MAAAKRPLRVVVVGWGALARRTVALLRERRSPVDIVAIGVRETAAGPDAAAGLPLLKGPQDLAASTADLVLEVASAAAVAPWGSAAFEAGADFAPVSISAFTDEAVHRDLARKAAAAGRQLLIPAGAIGGLDILRAAAMLPLSRVEHIIAKPPAAWKGTAAERLVDLDRIVKPVEIMTASARKVAADFPQNANSTVTSALAGIGLDRTIVTLVADPALDANRHLLRIEGAAGTYEVSLSNRPMPDNPKSSEMTALSLVSLVESEAVRLRD